MFRQRRGFSLLEVLVVIGIIVLLISILLPALHRARLQANIVRCGSNLHQVGIALQAYLNDWKGVTFWRGADVNTEGMDWYVYGGRDSGNLNLQQEGLFNRFVPRPLNKYVGNIEIFRCPADDAAPWTIEFPQPAPNQFEWVGNSYNFNADGYPHQPYPRSEGGLAGVQYSQIKDTSRTVGFYDACLYWGYNWHYRFKASVCFADAHVEFLELPDEERYRW